MNSSAPSLTPEQFQAALAAAKRRFALLREKYPSRKGYLVLSLLGEQTGIGSSPKEILKDFPSLIVADAAKLLLVDFLKNEKPKDGSEAEKKRLKEQYEQLASELRYNGIGQVEIRFDQLDYELIWQLQADELVDRALTPQTRASIRIVLGTLADFERA
ncbi:MAG: hypothetical protein WEB53_15815 [Akkermansiaceae bacterium]